MRTVPSCYPYSSDSQKINVFVLSDVSMTYRFFKKKKINMNSAIENTVSFPNALPSEDLQLLLCKISVMHNFTSVIRP